MASIVNIFTGFTKKSPLAVPEEEPFISTGITNLYSKSTPDPKYLAYLRNLYQILAPNLSLGDAKHDFEYTLEQIRSDKFKQGFNYGIPNPTSPEILDEEAALTSVIERYVNKTDEFTNTRSDFSYVPITVSNPLYQQKLTSEHTLTTISGHNYKVNYADVRKYGTFGASEGVFKSKYIDAPEFYDKLGLPNNISIVVDAASIGLYDILNNGNFADATRPRPNVYYIYGPEVVNDPAGKKAPYSKEFSSTKGVNLVPCVPMESNINNNLYYNYSFKINLPEEPPDAKCGTITTDPNISIPFYEQFFTCYQFRLSELKPSIKGRSKDYITNLNIFGKENNQIRSLPDSKSKNDITIITSFLNFILDKIFGTTRGILSNEENFQFSSALQQKRSGDWLQVLLCAAIKDRLRKFKNYKNEEDVTNFISEIYFVTHDRIALAFALLMGINCIFTHHNGKHHFHSVFVYKIQDPEAEQRQMQTLATSIRDPTKIQEMISKIALLRSRVDHHNRVYIDIVLNKISELQGFINTEIKKTTIIGGYDTKQKYNVAWFNRDTRALFTTSLDIIFAGTQIPNLTKYELPDDRKIVEMLTTSDNPTAIANFNNLNAMYKNISDILESTEKTITKYDKNLEKFHKSNVYLRANEWTWDSNITRRDISTLITGLEGGQEISYKSDNNIFLYNLNELDSFYKQQLAFIYYSYYKFLMSRFSDTVFSRSDDHAIQSKIDEFFINGTPTKKSPITPNIYLKFKAVSLAFCVEVMLTLGGNGINIAGITPKTGVRQIAASKIISEMENFLQQSPITNILISDNTVVQQDNEFNIETYKSVCYTPQKNEYESRKDYSKEPVPNNNDIPENLNIIAPTSDFHYDTQTSETDFDAVNDWPFPNTQTYEVEFDPNAKPEATAAATSNSSEEPDNDELIVTSTKQVTFPLLTFILTNGSYQLSFYTTTEGKIEPNIPNMPSNIGSEISNEQISFLTLRPDKPTFESTVVTHVNEDETVAKPASKPAEEPEYVEPNVTSYQIITPKYELPAAQRVEPNSTKPTRKISQKAGSLQNLKILLDSLPKPPINIKPIPINENDDVFRINSICFHPLLPIYMITQSYMIAINNEDIEESMDFELFVNYLAFLKKIKDNVVEIYSGENNTNINKLESYAIGIGLKQLLFISNNDTNGYKDCLDALAAEDSIYASVSSLTENFCSCISGKVQHPDIVLEQGPIYLKSNLFRQFARRLNVNRIFGISPDTTNFNLKDFRKKVLQFSTEVAEQIINDRKGLATTATSSSTISNAASGVKLSPFDPTRIKTLSDIAPDKQEQLESSLNKPIYSRSSTNSGGKKSRKYKQTKKNTRKQNQNTRKQNKTRKHKRVLHKKSRKH